MCRQRPKPHCGCTTGCPWTRTRPNAGFVVLARTSGADLLLWTSVYAISGRGAGQWVVDDGRMQGTMLLVVPSNDDRPLHDNDFVRSGMHYSEILSPAAHEVVVGERRSEWKIGNRTYVWQPPTWKVTGEHAGVDLDLVFAPTRGRAVALGHVRSADGERLGRLRGRRQSSMAPSVHRARRPTRSTMPRVPRATRRWVRRVMWSAS